MVHCCSCVIDGVVRICDVPLHLDINLVLCSVEVLEDVGPVI